MLDELTPPSSALPDVLPTKRLQPNGMLRPDLRQPLRQIPGVRNALSVAALWAGVAVLIAAATQLHRWWVVLIVFVLMGPVHVRFAILMHEAAHRLLFASKRANDLVGMWLIACPALVPLTLYRRSHMAHHREEFGPNEPDIAFYSGYPGPAAALRRRLVRDAVGISGWKNLKVLLLAMRTSSGRRIAGPIIAVQLVLWMLMWTLSGAWWAYPLLWLLPWMTQWRVLNRLRALGEHGGMTASEDRRLTTHNVEQHPLARLWFVPYNTGWHLAHHVDMGIPFRRLPAFHAELAEAGYVNDAMTFRSYTALWRACITPER